MSDGMLPQPEKSPSSGGDVGSKVRRTSLFGTSRSRHRFILRFRKQLPGMLATSLLGIASYFAVQAWTAAYIHLDTLSIHVSPSDTAKIDISLEPDLEMYSAGLLNYYLKENQEIGLRMLMLCAAPGGPDTLGIGDAFAIAKLLNGRLPKAPSGVPLPSALSQLTSKQISLLLDACEVSADAVLSQQADLETLRKSGIVPKEYLEMVEFAKEMSTKEKDNMPKARARVAQIEKVHLEKHAVCRATISISNSGGRPLSLKLPATLTHYGEATVLQALLHSKDQQRGILLPPGESKTLNLETVSLDSKAADPQLRKICEAWGGGSFSISLYDMSNNLHSTAKMEFRDTY